MASEFLHRPGEDLDAGVWPPPTIPDEDRDLPALRTLLAIFGLICAASVVIAAVVYALAAAAS